MLHYVLYSEVSHDGTHFDRFMTPREVEHELSLTAYRPIVICSCLVVVYRDPHASDRVFVGEPYELNLRMSPEAAQAVFDLVSSSAITKYRSEAYRDPISGKILALKLKRKAARKSC